MQRELNRRGWPQGENAIERLNGKKRQHPTNSATQQKLTQQHLLRFVFICYFGDDASFQHSRVERAFTLLDFLFSEIFPFSTVFYRNRCVRLICCVFSTSVLDIAILDIRLFVFIKVTAEDHLSTFSGITGNVYLHALWPSTIKCNQNASHRLKPYFHIKVISNYFCHKSDVLVHVSAQVFLLLYL